MKLCTCFLAFNSLNCCTPGLRLAAGKLPLLRGVLCAATLLWASTGHAVNLAEMQTLALNNREIVRQYMTTLEQSEKDITRAKGGYYPFADVSYTANRLDEAGVFENRENYAAEGRIGWNIFAGFRDKYTIQSAETRNEIEKFKLQGVGQDLQLNVALAYLLVFERRANRVSPSRLFRPWARSTGTGKVGIRWD